MKKILINEYIRLFLLEACACEKKKSAAARKACYIHANENEKCSDDNDDLIDEFSGVGAVMGYTLPLGMSSNNFKKEKSKY